ncbi:MAG: hypothetical protein CVU06_05890 [Bacteroidetes bacterium HGW-Bacteroidetes-22]|nr:MAG: hypothetical protein CVU06_05890 [Bacteroidetes bacterium HGW-Bacteroidetes-22]
MKTSLAKAFTILIRHFLWFMLLFALARLVFMVVYSGMIINSGASLTEVLAAFIYALHLDAATACYLITIPFLSLMVWMLTRGNWIRHFLLWYSCLTTMLISLMLGGELGLYSEWKTKLNYKALMYLRHPSEVFNSISTWQLILWFVVVGLFIFLMVLVYRKWFAVRTSGAVGRWWHLPVFIILVVPCVGLGIRGGIQEIPINQSASFYSTHGVLNAASVNTTFNLYISIFENRAFLDKNPYEIMPRETAEATVKKILTPVCDSTQSILTTRRPNVVIIILESWSADLIQSLGGEPGITPEFAKLEKKGVLFGQTYAGGSRSEQGMAALFSGFPPHPFTSITVQPDKYSRLASLPALMNKANYATSYYFGGQLIYGNIKSYIMFTGFHRIVEMDGFDASIPRGKLGVHDQYTLDRLLTDLDKEKQPFFSSLFTLSTHSPYDQPMEEKLTWGDNERHYINSAYYTDWCLGRFFAEASTKSWYPNTLFILVADHSHNSYRNWDPKTFEYHHIPMLWLGDVIKPEWRGQRYDKLVSQTDIATTLVNQLQLPDTAFFWSRNVLNKCYDDFTYHVMDDGVLGWKRPDGYFIEEMSFRKTFAQNLPPQRADSIRKEGYAFLQVLFQQYLDF